MSFVDKKKVIPAVQSVLCILLVVLLSITAIDLYRTGSAAKAADPLVWVYTREASVSALTSRLPIFILAVAVTVAAAVMGVRGNETSFTDAEIIRNLAVSRVKEPTAEMTAERSKQKRLHIMGWALFGLCMIPILLYITDPAHFALSDAAGLETVMGALVRSILPWSVIGLGCLCVCFILRDKSMARETELAKNCEKVKKSAEGGKSDTKVLNIIRLAVLALSVAFIVMGAFNGSMMDVLNKAIRICTECVGLG